jgi:dihydroneopterin aldolase
MVGSSHEVARLSPMRPKGAPVTDRIELRGLRVTTVVGVNAEERERAQPLELDLDIEADLRPAGQSDALTDTLDYGELTLIAARAADGGAPLLLERLADQVADALLSADQRVLGVAVTVRKLRPPIPVDIATAAVTIRRSRRA